MADAVVHVAANMQLAAEYYQRCGFDVMGPGRISTGLTINFNNLEELLDNMISRTEMIQLIVCHGSDVNGLLTPFARGSNFTATGGVITDLARLAKNSIPHLANNSHLPSDTFAVVDVASKMGVRPEVAIRLAEKLVGVQKKKLIVFVRGCNIGANQQMLRDYKAAFGAQMVTAPNCRMFFLRIRPHLPSTRLRQTMATLQAGSATTAKTRRKFFKQPSTSGFTSPLIIDVQDIDGHTRVDNEAFQSAPDPANAWAREFNFAWNGGLPNTFILPVMWNNDEATYHCPNELGYRERLVFV
ncbi:hypothetical protein [Dyadobacter arcticus]|uniref:VOC domain-containing protein n=1 Tax=Dyadobacter arcticus TaxID=1078754 RepID=A0ABX0UHG4_9BACT|nr:hypothetical protein [Dyadobacter arcticus]NIJ51145.1 hypothetical protein [Dyadobacter arcticus]